MRILIIGAMGQVGKNLVRVFESDASARVFKTARRGAEGFLSLDIAEADSVKKAFADSNPDVVYLCSALTNVDVCEREKDLARKINVEGPRRVSELCREGGSKLVFYSTEYVFDGKDGPYCEDDTPNPVNWYGKTKIEAERVISGICPSLIIRTTVIYGWDPGGKNFLMQVLGRAGKGEEMKVPIDQYSNPTWAFELARASADLAGLGSGGIYNLVGEKLESRHDFALEICGVFNLDGSLIKGVRTEEMNQAAARPLKAGLKTEKAFGILGKRLSAPGGALKIIKDGMNENTA